MPKPQSPELRRSSHGKTDQDGIEEGPRPRPEPKGETGPVPPDNQPGHHLDNEQDKPDLSD